MRKLEVYTQKYGPEVGRKLYHALQSQAAHAGVSARLRKKIDVLTGRQAPVPRHEPAMPLFEEASAVPGAEIVAESVNPAEPLLNA